jgi:SNF2 family DNA or RNA helicase
VAPAPRKSLAPWIHDEVHYYDHQIDGVRKLLKMRSFLLADDMGLGKSLTAMTVFAIDVKLGWSSKCLVICPVSLKGNWADEIDKFTTFPYVVLKGTKQQRMEQLLDFDSVDGPKILVVNYEQVVTHLSQLNALHFDVAIFDEAHYLKNPKSQRTKACHSLASRRSFMLTGTPMLNHANDLWGLLHRINPTKWPKYYPFVNRYCAFGGFQDKQIVGIKNENELIEQVSEVMVRRLKKDVLDLPEVQIIERRVDLTAEQLKVYEQIRDELTVPAVDADSQEIENALTKFLRLKQVCGTTLPFTGEDHSSKLDLACEDDMELLENGHKIVQFTQFRSVQTAYIERMQKTGVGIWVLNGDVKPEDRAPIVKRWAEASGPGILVCMLQVAGVGLNMTASQHGSFLDELFVPGLNQQAIDRLNRIGASDTQAIQIRRYICRNTIENRVQQILKIKQKEFGIVIEADSAWKRKLMAAIMEEEDAA